uniref:Addiction module antitoxin n=1 Tax=uncultured Thiotrichaceae bacterium TaxID=298394 RepID=A0A6S6SYI5_9GAMM|nr:MAG: Addiction module antitoxin [uncultured Thiotrichaceae bacterium]
MSETMNLNVRVSGALRDYVSSEIESGSYENVSEYVRDLIRKEKDRSEQAAFEHMKAELQLAFAAYDSEYIAMSADDVFARHSGKHTQ